MLPALPPRRADFEAPGDSLDRPHDNCYWLLPGRLLAGEHPVGRGNGPAQTRRLAGLVDAGVRCVVNLTDPSEGLPAYALPLQQAATLRGATVRVLQLPITDFSVPDVAGMQRILATIQAAWAADEPVYLHCHGGIGRTGTVVGCLLVEHGFSGEQALALILSKWQVMEKRHWAPHSPETDAQRDFIRRWVPAAPASPAG